MSLKLAVGLLMLLGLMCDPASSKDSMKEEIPALFEKYSCRHVTPCGANFESNCQNYTFLHRCLFDKCPAIRKNSTDVKIAVHLIVEDAKLKYPDCNITAEDLVKINSSDMVLPPTWNFLVTFIHVAMIMEMFV